MDIRVLQYFLTVAGEGSITKAAEVLHITQPPLSRQLKDLEDELGKQLFIRGSKRITLTEDGLLLRKRAEEIIDLMEKTKSELKAPDEIVSGDVRIGCGETNAIRFLANTAQTLSDKYPLIHYRLYSGDAERVIEKLDKGLIDFGLLIGSVDINKYDYVRFPVADKWGAIMRKDNPLAEKETVSAEDLRDKPLILSHQAFENSEMSAWLQVNTSKLNVVVTYDLAYNASLFVKTGFGYMIALDEIIDTTQDSDLCFRPLYPAMEAGICVVWKKHQVFSRASELFLEELKNTLKYKMQ